MPFFCWPRFLLSWFFFFPINFTMDCYYRSAIHNRFSIMEMGDSNPRAWRQHHGFSCFQPFECLLTAPPSQNYSKDPWKNHLPTIFFTGKLSCCFRKIIYVSNDFLGINFWKIHGKDHENHPCRLSAFNTWKCEVLFSTFRRGAQQVMVHPAEIPEANDGIW